MSDRRYGDARAVVSAMGAIAKNDDAWPTPRTVQERQLTLLQHRLLTRVFADGQQSGWMLKGGFGILARVPDGRFSTDVDVQRSGGDVPAAIADLQRLAATDADDHVRFVLKKRHALVGGESGASLSFECYIGQQRRGVLSMDVVVSPEPVGRVDVLPAANVPSRPFLSTVPYRMYPVTDQIADKICATVRRYGDEGLASTRAKDLVDLVVLTRTQQFDADELRLAINTGLYRRGLSPISELTVPATWEQRYRELAAGVPHCRGVASVDAAVSEVNDCLVPVLRGEATGRWNSTEGWGADQHAQVDTAVEVDQLDGVSGPVSAGAGGQVWIQPHTRNGVEVSGHWRQRR
ncbi:nucleotidyl transferase AbiEii/AbiGii toxin family protein [Pseudoclavibacter sp. AY1H1]|uniref:nucleotidyl transferase AbiEii/AbiGii toxin family protein n=1 Tax=Pseudoclavibacter sp. AY1H1 TaxID=2080584 RepID=UPI000CE86898|nr:nucleotidyl transferase AbiEii/AbiGii toxin family protein [Pseudoclavibacter sp. AY1H1]PPF32676.1 hypothetical protein C5E05_19420 [Pseudoclavibacter sp. AY1H1]